MKACIHLDYTTKFGPDIQLVDLTDQGMPNVRFWLRGPTWTDNGEGKPPNPAKVQFCGAGRGRINGIFQCYNKGEMHCYETD